MVISVAVRYDLESILTYIECPYVHLKHVDFLHFWSVDLTFNILSTTEPIEFYILDKLYIGFGIALSNFLTTIILEWIHLHFLRFSYTFK